eukprot:13935757-Ditylum_brightwellii.AAC.1
MERGTECGRQKRLAKESVKHPLSSSQTLELRDYANWVITTKGDIESKIANNWKTEFKSLVLNDFHYYKEKYDSA